MFFFFFFKLRAQCRFVPVAAHGSYEQSGPCVLHFLQLRTNHFLSGDSVTPQGQLSFTHHHVQLHLPLPFQKQDVLCKHSRDSADIVGLQKTVVIC